jgi:hypothetical protein
MHKMRFKSALVGGFLFAATLMGSGSVAAVEFAADSYQKGPQGESSGRIYVGKKRIRMESVQGGQQVVQIIDSEQGSTWVLYPGQRSYLEMPGQGGGASSARVGKQQGESSPCEFLPSARCERQGVESVNGRTAVKWHIVSTQQGQPVESTQWIDQEKGIALRQEMSGGQRMDMKLLGEDNISGRSVEKWEVTMSQGTQQAQQLLRWFDPELNLAIREEFPGGFVREMKNIKLAPQDASLFEVPAGYKKIALPQGGQRR